jgi:hypothetical protein
MYESVASTNKNNHGVANLAAQAINISGGTIPRIVSEARKNENITCGEYVSTKVFSNELKSKKKYSRPIKIIMNMAATIPPLKAVSLRKE